MSKARKNDDLPEPFGPISAVSCSQGNVSSWIQRKF